MGRGIKVGIPVLGLLLGLAVPVAAGPFEDAFAAYTRHDYATALQLFRPLAEQGNADAQFYLGNIYDFGWGVPQDYAEAVKWRRMAADQGDTGAQTNLGIMYREGKGVPRDYAEAVRLFREAANGLAAASGAAMEALGIMYRDGLGVPQDYVQAHMWFNLAAARFLEGKNTAAEARELVAKKMTPAQIAEAQKLAREWEPK